MSARWLAFSDQTCSAARGKRPRRLASLSLSLSPTTTWHVRTAAFRDAFQSRKAKKEDREFIDRSQVSSDDDPRRERQRRPANETNAARFSVLRCFFCHAIARRGSRWPAG